MLSIFMVYLSPTRTSQDNCPTFCPLKQSAQTPMDTEFWLHGSSELHSITGPTADRPPGVTATGCVAVSDSSCVEHVRQQGSMVALMDHVLFITCRQLGCL